MKKISIPPAEIIVLKPRSEKGVAITADLRLSRQKNERTPAMLILHGAAPWGRKAGLVQLLGFRLFMMGWTVLAPDARGFGDSEDPEQIHNPQAWEVTEDVHLGIDYLWKNSLVDPKQLFVLGHSMGANHALQSALSDKRVAGVILIGPSRFEAKNVVGFKNWWWRIRFSADRRLSQPVSPEVMAHVIRRSDISLYVKELSQRNGQRILLLDGELEGRWNLEFLGRIARQIEPPLEYHTLPGTGHYCGVWNFWGSKTIYYQPELFEPFFQRVLNFINAVPQF